MISRKELGLSRKGTTGYSKNGTNDAVTPSNLTQILIPNNQPYGFSYDAGLGPVEPTVYSQNVFKRDPGFAGLVTRVSTGNPVPDVKVEIYDPTDKLLATVYTNGDGYYMYQYKYTGKRLTYTVKLPDYGLATQVTLKSNGFAIVNFEVP